MSLIDKVRRIIERPAVFPIGLLLRYAHLFKDQKALVKGIGYP